jgi:ABC-type transport system substrate-binding protein
LNFSDPALADTRVRQAFLYALDRNILNDEILGAVNKVAIVNGWLSPASPDLNTYEFDPDRARQLLEEAGWDSSREIVAQYEAGVVRDDLPVIAEMLGAVGINISFEALDPAAVQSTIFENSDYTVWYGTGAGSLDGSPWLAGDDILSTAIFPEGFNSMHYVNEEFDEHYLAGQRAVDPEVARTEFEAASLVFNEDLPFLPLYQRRDYTFLNDDLRGPETATLLHPFAGGLEYWNWHFDS